MSFGDLQLHDHYDISSLVETEVVQGQIQWPIRDFTEPRDDFMVHGVNGP